MPKKGRIDPESDDYKIGQKIKKYRLAKGLTQDELAERAGITPVTVYRAEKGENSLKFLNTIAICKALEITPNDIMPDEDIEDMCTDTPDEYKEMTGEEKKEFWLVSRYSLTGILCRRRKGA